MQSRIQLDLDWMYSISEQFVHYWTNGNMLKWRSASRSLWRKWIEDRNYSWRMPTLQRMRWDAKGEELAKGQQQNWGKVVKFSLRRKLEKHRKAWLKIANIYSGDIWSPDQCEMLETTYISRKTVLNSYMVEDVPVVEELSGWLKDLPRKYTHKVYILIGDNFYFLK